MPVRFAKTILVEVVEGYITTVCRMIEFLLVSIYLGGNHINDATTAIHPEIEKYFLTC